MTPDPRMQIIVRSLKEHAEFLGKKIDQLPQPDLSETNILLRRLIEKADEGYEITLDIE